MSDALVPITCPHCWQVFAIPGPAPSETPTTWDYDCEVCCRPMVIHFSAEEDAVFGDARSLDEA